VSLSSCYFRFVAVMEQQESELTLEVLFAKLKLNPDDVLNVYLLGSRLWGQSFAPSSLTITSSRNGHPCIGL